MEHALIHFKKVPNNSLVRITKLSEKLRNPKFILFVNIFIFLITCILSICFFISISKNFNMPIIILGFLFFLLCFISSIFGIHQSVKLLKTIDYLKEAHLHTKNALLLNEDLHIIKHDFSNIIQCMGGYIINNDMAGLKKYYDKIKKEFENINSLNILNSSFINDSALYNLISQKYTIAEEQDISFNINVSVKFDKIQVSSYALTRILGILLDNAIEATRNCTIKEIYFDVSPCYEKGKLKKHIISIQNTYSNKDVNIDKIREKGYTSKTAEKDSHGLGLWEVNKILKKSKNLNLYTTKNDDFFVQELEIYVNK